MLFHASSYNAADGATLFESDSELVALLGERIILVVNLRARVINLNGCKHEN